MFSLRAWHIREVYYNGASLYDHEQCSIYNKAVKDSRNKKQKENHIPYEFHRRREAIESISHAHVRLSVESINAVASTICCSRNCVQPFPRIDVCPRAWYLIHGIGKSTFYRHAKDVENGARAGEHGNTWSKKTRIHIVQATATLQCLVANTANHMPHRSITLDSGEKVVSMQLPPSFKWKEMLPQMNVVNTSMGLQKVSQSGLSLIWKNSFPEYSSKKLGDNFA